jgi:hypothetical protein
MRVEYLFLLPLLAALAITTLPVLASTGMSNCREEPDDPDCNDQPDRVGNDEENDEDADRDGPGGEDDTPEEEDDDPDTPQNDDANCWGKVTSELAEGEGIGDHSSDPVGGDEDNETPREGVGNQVEGHPSDHADTVGPRFGSDEECTQD